MSIVVGTNTIIKENILVKEVIRLLGHRFNLLEWTNKEFEGVISQVGDTVSVQTFPRISFTTGTTAGADISATNFTIAKETLIIDQLMQLMVPVSNLEEIQSNLNLRKQIAEQFVYSMKQKMESYASYIAMSQALTANKLHDARPGSAVTKSNIYAAFEEARVTLSTLNAFSSDSAAFVTPSIASLVRQAPEFDGFREGLDARIEGYVGKLSGFKIFETNNLSLSGRMLFMEKNAVHFAVQWTGMDERKEPKGFRTNILAEFAMGCTVFDENSNRIVTYRYLPGA